MALVDALPHVKLEVPGEPGDYFMVRELGWKELQDCRDVKARSFTQAAKELGPELLESFSAIEQGQGSDDDAAALAKAKEKRADPRQQFDKEMLLSRSVMDWSYDGKFSKARLDQLDEKTAEWLFGAIAALYVSEESEDDRGNASTPSTAS